MNLARLISLLSLLISVSAPAGRLTPVRDHAAGVSTLVRELRARKVGDVGSFMDLFGGRINVIQRKIPSLVDHRPSSFPIRYLYSPRWGWLDALHFAAGVWTDSIPLVHGYRVLKNGEESERKQQRDGDWSRWDYEDLISNLLGVCFEEYLETLSSRDERDFAGKLDDWLRLHGFVDDPRASPNWSRMMLSEDRDDPTENHRYVPLNVPAGYESLYTADDRAILAYLEGYLRWVGRTRDDQVQ